MEISIEKFNEVYYMGIVVMKSKYDCFIKNIPYYGDIKDTDKALRDLDRLLLDLREIRENISLKITNNQ